MRKKKISLALKNLTRFKKEAAEIKADLEKVKSKISKSEYAFLLKRILIVEKELAKQKSKIVRRLKNRA